MSASAKGRQVSPASLLILDILLVSLLKLQAQPQVDWEKFYIQWEGEEQERSYCYDLILTSDGGFAMCGERHAYWEAEDSHGTEAFLIVTDTTGDTLWSRGYKPERTSMEAATEVVQAGDGGFLMVGWGNRYGFVLRVDDSGEFVWKKVFEEEDVNSFYGLVNTDDGGYVASGVKHGDPYSWLFKIDDSGEVIWSHQYRTETRNGFGLLIPTYDGGFAVAGHVATDSSGYDGLLVKVDSEGELEWYSTFGTELGEATQVLTQTPDGGYAVAGYQRVNPPFGDQAYMGRFDADGQLLWTKNLPGILVRSIICSSLDDGFVVAGFSGASVSVDGRLQHAFLWTAHFDRNGEELWRLDIEGSSSFGLSSIIELPDNSYATAGEATRFWREEGPNVDSFILCKTTPDPVEAAPARLQLSADSLDFGSVAVDSDSVATLLLRNVSLRDGRIDSVTVTDSMFIENGVWAFTCQPVGQLFPFDLASRDTAYFTVTFHPWTSDAYTGVVQFWANGEALELYLSGCGYYPDEVPNFAIRNSQFALMEVYPNPFNSQTAVSYQLSAFSRVNLSLYDINGRLVQTLVDGWQGAGEHRATIGGQAGTPAPLANGGQAGTPAPLSLPAGVYFLHLQAEGQAGMTVLPESRKVVVVR